MSRLLLVLLLVATALTLATAPQVGADGGQRVNSAVDDINQVAILGGLIQYF